MAFQITPIYFGRYEILAELGRGGMGVVYRAVDKGIGREVAIKTLTAATPELRQRFLVEARTGVLNHPNIVTIHDLGEQEGHPYIVMEYLQGQSLEDALLTPALSLLDKLEIARQVCEGLAYAHSKGVVHRDIKPANIMVQPGNRIKIVDFGIARLESIAGHTQAGGVIGTFHYIAPERLMGLSSDRRADIWSAGIMLYQMITGVLPFPGDNVSTLHRVVHEPYPPLQAYAQSYPPGLLAIVAKALAKAPEQRYNTAGDMAADLTAVCEQLRTAQAGEPVQSVNMPGTRESGPKPAVPAAASRPGIFLCCLREASSEWAIYFSRELQQAGVSVFLEVVRGDNALCLSSYVKQKIAGCDVFVCLLAPATLGSSCIVELIDFAGQHQKPMVPVFHENFDSGESPETQNASIKALLNSDPVYLFDQRNLYVKEAIEKLTAIIQGHVHPGPER